MVVCIVFVDRDEKKSGLRYVPALVIAAEFDLAWLKGQSQQNLRAVGRVLYGLAWLLSPLDCLHSEPKGAGMRRGEDSR